jgi:hypothetical protein
MNKNLLAILVALAATGAHANGKHPPKKPHPHAGATSSSKAAAVSRAAAQAGSASFSQGGAASAQGGVSRVGDVSPAQTTTITSTQARNAASTAYAAGVFPTANCAMGTSVGAQGMGAGLSLGTTHLDENCATIEQAKAVANLGDPYAAQEVLCSLPKVREARKRTGNPCWSDRTENIPAQSSKCRWLTDPLVRAREDCHD